MEQIKEILKTNKPNLAESSIKTYASNLKNIYYKVFGESKIIINNFNKDHEIMKYLETYEPQKRKTILASLFVLTNNLKYQDQMMSDIHHYNENIKMQIKDPKQTAYWLSKEELDSVYSRERDIANHIYKKKKLDMDDLQKIMNYIILSLYLLTSPRRSKDYVEMKIKNINSNEDNYIKNNDFYFNQYKTSKYYGLQKQAIPKELMKILKKWITAQERLVPEGCTAQEGRKINPTDYLLFDVNGNKLSSSKLTHRLNSIFHKKLSTSGLRHLYLSHKYPQLIEEHESLNNDLKHMGASHAQHKVYLKK
jgi:hypothetical protein